MICQEGKGCGGAGTIWKNNRLIDCPKCGGTGEISKMKHIPTYLQPKEECSPN